MKATEQFFPLVLFIMKYKVVLTFDSVDEILKCNHSNESYRGEGGGGGTFLWYCLLCCTTCFFYQLCTSLWTFFFFVLNRKAIVHRLSAQMNLFQALRLYVPRSHENWCKSEVYEQ